MAGLNASSRLWSSGSDCYIYLLVYGWVGSCYWLFVVVVHEASSHLLIYCITAGNLHQNLRDCSYNIMIYWQSNNSWKYKNAHNPWQMNIPCHQQPACHQSIASYWITVTYSSAFIPFFVVFLLFFLADHNNPVILMVQAESSWHLMFNESMLHYLSGRNCKLHMKHNKAISPLFAQKRTDSAVLSYILIISYIFYLPLFYHTSQKWPDCLLSLYISTHKCDRRLQRSVAGGRVRWGCRGSSTVMVQPL